MEMNFCRRCGSELVEVSVGIYTCNNGHRLYVNPAPAVGMFFINRNNEVLLSVRGIEPFKGMLDSFGGFVDANETAEKAIERELTEELGLHADDYEKPVFLSTELVDYPYQDEKRNVLSIFFWSRLKPHANPIAADDVASTKLVPLHQIDFSELDNVDVKEALKKLQLLFPETL